MKRFAVAAAVLIVGCAPAKTDSREAMPSVQDQTAGAKLYEQHCAICHGATGKGDGYAAAYLYPKPRDFSLAQYKIRSTESGNLPTDADLDATLVRGMPGSAMPSFANLKPEERKALIQHLKTFAVVGGKNLFEIRGEPKKIGLAEPPSVTDDLLARGKRAYRDAGCVKCHGEYGRADGPSSDTLRDNWGMPIRANDFTRGYFKGGAEPADIMMRFLSGMNGTPMPSFKGQLSEEDMWALAYYVKSLSGSSPAHSHKSELAVPVKRVTGPIKADPQDPVWKDLSAVSVPMMGLWQRAQSVRNVSVKAIHNGSEVAIHVEWEDPTVNGATLRFQDFSDAIAVMFPSGARRPNFVMGTKGDPCNIWHWKFDKQLDLAKYFDTQDQYPGMVADDCGPCGRSPNKNHSTTESAPSHDRIFMTGRGAGNPVSQDRKTCVEDLLAVGPGTLTSQGPDEQNVQGRGFWVDGRWSVVFVRSLISPDAKDAHFAPGHNSWIAFAVWDGAKGDRDGQKAVCYWQSLQFEK
jgi:cytochrome c oxidase cbb3-type subunit 2